MAKSESDNPIQGRIPPLGRSPAVRHKRVKETIYEERALVKTEMLLNVYQTAHDWEALRPADGLQIVESQIVVAHFLGAGVEDRNETE